MQRCAHFRDRFSVVVLEEQKNAQISPSIHVLRITRNDLPEDGNGKLGLLLLEVLQSLLLQIGDLLPLIGCILRGNVDRAPKNQDAEDNLHHETLHFC
ncbi:MAG: hypothetical protein WBP71_20695 [Terracidiphilus sp.]